MVSAVILAAGLSSRMGQHKMLLPYKNDIILSATIRNIQASLVNKYVLVLGHNAQAVREILPKGVPFVFNADYEQGMTSSIQCGIRNLNLNDTGDIYGIMVCLGDMPAITAQQYDDLITSFEQAYKKNPNTILVPFYQDQRANPVIFSSIYAAEILEHKSSFGCKGLISKYKQYVNTFPITSASYISDIDTPQDYQRLLSLKHLE